ncbi:MAG: histidine triad nucleotide-binding protein [Clostridia bacterium]|nr:histidine triad nucleotide-binding protein [Clostridia bacterium]
MNDCLFCKIVKGDIPSKKAYEDDRVYAFYDIAPAAPVHVLVIPKEHVLAGVDEITEKNADIVGYIFSVIPKIAKELGLTNGYRVVSNVGADAGQTVRHIHFHIIGGAELGAMA